MSTRPPAATPYYFVPSPSRFPVQVAAGLLLVMFGASQWVNGAPWAPWVCAAGVAVWLAVLFQWFRQAAHESEGGAYSERVGASYRWGMAWFIFSEVMFFAAFFGALFYARNLSLPALGDLDHRLLWPDFKAVWPSNEAGATGSPAGVVEPFGTIGPWPLPTLNTALLLSSGLTLTVAHHRLLAGERTRTIRWMWLTVALGLSFLAVQITEYHHAYTELNLKLSSGIFGSTFFMLTGFHGFHVFVGMLMLTFITLRLRAGHFTPERHFGFQGAAWYWHFVDVVWLGLYLVVYWL
ncbi:cytochrome c oxidase subunit 3 [Rubrivivax gelatinosus]|uniref:cytochrome-c oxidase n=1 Tax=Rubrivivax gelatinosus TaxID=28068 RepID=A0ABS1DRZ3_RUBGE|nr:cytochrome c oxidase subunit 3 [Rubrivivax gelatinosus]MBK1614676.1 cytochrome c oxidase subunit 3 [Rubrivivax gelatinosus]MBK1712218.1 cytochrome c oxidase subunit 3 [Rubrivivax gelatinosus]